MLNIKDDADEAHGVPKKSWWHLSIETPLREDAPNSDD